MIFRPLSRRVNPRCNRHEQTKSCRCHRRTVREWRQQRQSSIEGGVDRVDGGVDKVYIWGVETLEAFREGFVQEFDELLKENPLLHDAFNQLLADDGIELGRLGARAALAPLLWKARVGESWDVTRTAEFLDVSRQALYKRLKNGSLLGVRGRGTTWFPTWQFDMPTNIVRSVVALVVAQFREADTSIDPLVIAAWATKPSRFLDGQSPAEWISNGRSDEAVLLAARRATAGLRA